MVVFAVDVRLGVYLVGGVLGALRCLFRSFFF